MPVLLETKNLGIRFGGLKAVDGLSLTINQGELVGLIGPNGAGKTTAFNLLTGVYIPTSGDVVFDGESLKGKLPYQIARRGMTRTFQNIRLFRDLTVLENVMIASSHLCRYGMIDAVFSTKKFSLEEKAQTERAEQLLEIFGLASKRDENSASLPYGEQRKLEVVRALAANPKLICLDEPAAGMNHQETHDLMELIARVRKEFGLTVLLIEHDMKLVMGICERIYVLDHGILIEEGVPQKIQTSPRVIEAYLGVEE